MKITELAQHVPTDVPLVKSAQLAILVPTPEEILITTVLVLLDLMMRELTNAKHVTPAVQHVQTQQLVLLVMLRNLEH